MSIHMLKKALINRYIVKKQSSAQIAAEFRCSQGKINYWLAKYKVPKRNISEAIYQLRNPTGNPFALQKPRTVSEGVRFGLGVGLYWGEGLKRGRGGIRLGNTDPKLIRKFIDFLEKMFNVDRTRLRFGLQIFNDVSPRGALAHWMRELQADKEQFYKVMVSKVRGRGTYRHKSEHGVLTVYFNNTRLREQLCRIIEKMD